MDAALHEAFEALKAAPRPEWSETDDDVLDDIIVDIYGAEPFIAGLAFSALAGIDPLPYASTDLSDLRRRLASHDPAAADLPARDSIDAFLTALERVTTELAKYRMLPPRAHEESCAAAEPAAPVNRAEIRRVRAERYRVRCAWTWWTM